MLEKYDTYALIDLDAIVHNVLEIQNKMGTVKVLAVLKADAYGLKASEVFKALVDAGIKYFAVATYFEAIALRVINPKVDILVFGRVAPHNISEAIDNNISMTIYSKECWDELKKVATVKDKKARVHIKINTGLNRIGLKRGMDTLSLVKEISECNKISIEGIYSHLALCNLEEDEKQFKIFNDTIADLEMEGINFPIKHIADSIVAIDYPWARMDMVRLGAVMYGLTAAGRASYANFNLKPTVKLYSTITQINDIEVGEGVSYDYLYRAEKPIKIATIAFGYADGYPRNLWKNGYALVNGEKANFTGLLCMDQSMLDVTDIVDVKVGDKVLLYDINLASEVSLAKVSILAGTNKNDILASLAKRVIRIYNYKGKSYAINQC